MTLSALTACIHHYCLGPELFIHQKEPPWPLAAANLFSFSMDLPILDISK